MPHLRYRPTRLILQTMLRTLGADLRPVLALLALCAVLVFAVWTWTLAVIAQDKQRIRDELRVTAASDAGTYATQLARSMSQVDFIMLSQKFHWEKMAGKVDLDQQRQAGLLPPSSDLIVTIVDQHGNPVTSTLPFKNNRTNIAGRPYFLEHKEKNGLGMTVSRPNIGLRLGREVIMLTRRLDGRNGSFGGVIVVAIEPAYLASNLGAAALERGDLVAAYRADWTFLAGNVQMAGAVPAARARLRPPAGTAEVSGEHYRDGLARIVAWRKVEGYPLFAAVALSEQQRLDSYGGRERELRLQAALATAALLLLAACALAYVLWNASRKLDRREAVAAYRLATENADAGVFMLRPLYGADRHIGDFTVEDCNEYGARAAGLTCQQVTGAKLSSLQEQVYFTDLVAACRQAIEAGSFEDVLRLPDASTGSVRWMHRRVLRSGSSLAVTIRDETAARAQAQQLEQQANVDALTQLPNRSWLTRQLPAAIEQARRADSALAVLMLDLDDFRKLNEAQGHAIGDELLRAVARRLQGQLGEGEGDGVARLGGDEFTVILHAPGGDVQVAAVAQRIVEQLGEPFVIGSGVRHVASASIGISVFPRDGEDGATLLKHADIAMYAAKENGKGHFRFFDAHLAERLARRLG